MSAVAAPARAAPAPRAGRFAPRVEHAFAAVLLLGAVGLWALTRTYPNYDSYYHLVWGRELLAGLRPSFEAYSAPTEHPLWIALCAVLGLVGEDADRLLVLVCLLAHAALIFGTYRVGADVFGRWPGLLAAAFVGASASFLLYAARGYVDSPFLALVVWAAAFEAARPGRFALSGGLLALAGLLRPEAWVLAGLYAVWGWRRAEPRERAILAGALVLPPLLWGVVDASVTGDPLHSFHATTELADELNRERGIGAVPGAFVSFVGATVRPPVAALALAGAVIAWWHPGRQALRVPVALFACGVATFVGTGILGLSIIPRYLTVPAVALCLPAGWLVTRSRVLLALAVVAGLAFVVVRADAFGRLATELRFIRSTHDGLTAILRTPEVRAGRRCGPVTLPNYRLVPDTRWVLDATQRQVGSRSARPRRHGVALLLVGDKLLRRYGFADGASPKTNTPPDGFLRGPRRGGFTAYIRCA